MGTVHRLSIAPPQPTEDAKEAGREACDAVRRVADLYPEMRMELLALRRTLAAILRLDG